MINEVFASEETVELAKQKACDMLGVRDNEVEFEVLQQPSKKVLGMFGGKLAQVKAVLKKTPARKAEEFLKEVFFYMGLGDLFLEVTEDSPEHCDIRACGDKVGYIVGKHGETLDSLQYLASLVANSGKSSEETFCKIRLEAGNYRENRKKVLESLGKNLAIRSRGLGKKLSLEPMKSYERKIIHTAIGNIDGVRSWSEGEGNMRHVVVMPKNLKSDIV